jgi:hypothetical protein
MLGADTGVALTRGSHHCGGGIDWFTVKIFAERTDAGSGLHTILSLLINRASKTEAVRKRATNIVVR